MRGGPTGLYICQGYAVHEEMMPLFPKYPAIGKARTSGPCAICDQPIMAGGYYWKMLWLRAHVCCGWKYNYDETPLPAELEGM